MRYGRSWPPPNFIPNSMWQLDEKMDKPEKKGKTGRDIMRFGRSNVAPLVEVSKGGGWYNDGVTNIGRSYPDSFMIRFGDPNVQDYQPESVQASRTKKNYIRFGRSHPSTATDPSITGNNEDRGQISWMDKINEDKVLNDQHKTIIREEDEENFPLTAKVDESKTEPCKRCIHMQFIPMDAKAPSNPEIFDLTSYILHKQRNSKRTHNFIRLG
ncbi:hypothetical protein GE061_000769 [Apolygus lucorum]|uniref:Uncharacterized protein n=1 Tax=Apolygus lucorum TaxID=248454 RepID=A0A8S9Y592_APOLU|nr:hypothetical protein GE061_000769 [Apolygus lucorum]